jgi:hypothetical protein
MERFVFEKLQPIGDDFWKAEVVISTPESIDGRNVAQTATLTIRFKCRHDQAVEVLLQTALDEARRCLAGSSAFLQDQALSDLLDRGAL